MFVKKRILKDIIIKKLCPEQLIVSFEELIDTDKSRKELHKFKKKESIERFANPLFQAFRNYNYLITSVDYINDTIYAQKVESDYIVSLNGEEKLKASKAFLENLLSKKQYNELEQQTVEELELLHDIIWKKAWIAMSGKINKQQSEHDEYILSCKEIICSIVLVQINSLKEIDVETFDFDNWMKERITATSVEHMTPGLWQKIYNITLKYIYTIKLVFPTHFGEYSEELLRNFHCPIDSIICLILLEKMRYYRESLDGYEEKYTLVEALSHSANGGWNALDYQKYKKVQDTIKSVCEQENLSSNMLFDITYWNA